MAKRKKRTPPKKRIRFLHVVVRIDTESPEFQHQFEDTMRRAGELKEAAEVLRRMNLARLAG